MRSSAPRYPRADARDLGDRLLRPLRWFDALALGGEAREGGRRADEVRAQADEALALLERGLGGSAPGG